MSRNYFIFDTNKCVGCDACIVACVNENGFQQPDTWRKVSTSIDPERPGIPLFHFSMACNHCDDAPCMASCPALVYNRSGITGAVLHEANKCIGCQYCAWTCPYEAPKYVPTKGVIEKCNFCESRLIEGNSPVCVSLCPTGALDFSFGEILKVEDGIILPVKVDPKPSLIIKPLNKGRGPEVDRALYPPMGLNPLEKNAPSNIKKEWPLLLFTLISSIMVGITSTGFFHELEFYGKLLFPVTGLISAIISIMHLGVKHRAWRAILNLRNSWVSREILLFSMFYIIGTLGLFVFDLSLSIIILVGIFFLYAIDMLYWPVQPKQRNHSAQALFIGLSTYLLFNNHIQLLAIIMAIRLYLFIKGRTWPFSASSIIRIVSMVMTGLLFLWNVDFWIVFCVFIIGEFIDRMYFYHELEKPDVSKMLEHATLLESK